MYDFAEFRHARGRLAVADDREDVLNVRVEQTLAQTPADHARQLRREPLSLDRSPISHEAGVPRASNVRRIWTAQSNLPSSVRQEPDQPLSETMIRHCIALAVLSILTIFSLPQHLRCLQLSGRKRFTAPKARTISVRSGGTWACASVLIHGYAENSDCVGTAGC